MYIYYKHKPTMSSGYFIKVKYMKIYQINAVETRDRGIFNLAFYCAS